MKKKVLLVMSLLLVVFAVSGCKTSPPLRVDETTPLIADETLRIGEFTHVTLVPSDPKHPKKEINAKVVRTPADLQNGLMNVHNLPKAMGMLFVFSKPDTQSFWMKNTLIPLDILFIDDQKKIVNIAISAQPCKTEPCVMYKSAKPVRYVLEMNGGLSNQWGLKDGDSAQFAFKTIPTVPAAASQKAK